MPDYDSDGLFQEAEASPASEAPARIERPVLSDAQCHALLEEAFGPITNYRILLDDLIPF